MGSISPLQPSARNWSFEAGGRRQKERGRRKEAEGKRQKERGRRKEAEGRSQKKYFYKYEMLPCCVAKAGNLLLEALSYFADMS
ncbi:hypothetical protein QUB12_21470 [Microcoleus sp. B7-D4]